MSSCFLLLFSGTLMAQGNWQKKANAGNAKRNSAVAFSINGKAYAGTGLSSSGGVLADFWEYDPGLDQWSKKASVPGARYGALAFSIGNYAYVVSGGGNGFPYADTWRYDPLNNSWTQMKAFPAEGRVFGIAFSAAGKGYVGLGLSVDGSKTYNDMWEYDPASDNWTQRSSYPGLGRFGAIAFALNGKGYAGTGESASGAQLRDFWQYNPASDSWIQSSSFPGSPRAFAVGFALGSLGYIGTGESGHLNFTNDVFAYDPSQDSWQTVTNLPGVARFYAIAFSVGNSAYIACGADSAYSMVKAGNDVWAYSTTPTMVNDETGNALSWKIYPNPARDYIELSLYNPKDENVLLELTNLFGQSLRKEYLSSNHGKPIHVSLSGLTNGFYLLKLGNGSSQLLQKFYKH